MQVPDVHCADEPQVVRHAVPSLAHTKGVQLADEPRLHDPVPSQVDSPVSVLVDESQCAGAQVTFFQYRQAPWPSHLPSVPQVVCAVAGQPV